MSLRYAGKVTPPSTFKKMVSNYDDTLSLDAKLSLQELDQDSWSEVYETFLENFNHKNHPRVHIWVTSLLSIDNNKRHENLYMQEADYVLRIHEREHCTRPAELFTGCIPVLQLINNNNHATANFNDTEQLYLMYNLTWMGMGSDNNWHFTTPGTFTEMTTLGSRIEISASAKMMLDDMDGSDVDKVHYALNVCMEHYQKLHPRVQDWLRSCLQYTAERRKKQVGFRFYYYRYCNVS